VYGGAPEVAHTYSRARALCQEVGEETPQLCPVLAGRCSFYLVRGALQTALDLASQLLPVAQQHADALVALANDQGFAYWLAQGEILQGWTLAASGQGTAGLAQMRQGLAALQATGVELTRPGLLTQPAEGYAHAGQPAQGLTVLAEALAAVQRMEERSWEAELYRCQGALLLTQVPTDAVQAERYFQQSLTVARQQQARSWELRAALSLASLWQQQGQREVARTLLAPIYSWFTEGFDTADLQEAQGLLHALGGVPARPADGGPGRTWLKGSGAGP
jgi:predicted ATPase